MTPNLGPPNTILISKVQKEVLFSCLITGLPVSSISRPKTAFKKELASTMGCNFAASWFPAFRSPYFRALNQTLELAPGYHTQAFQKLFSNLRKSQGPRQSPPLQKCSPNSLTRESNPWLPKRDEKGAEGSSKVSKKGLERSSWE